MNIKETRSQLEIMNGNKIQEKKVWKLVLTGGPCGGKTTGETEIFSFQCRLQYYFFKLKYIYSEKATNFYKIFTFLCSNGQIYGGDLSKF